MSRNNTGNPIGSKAFLDFEDNVKNLDEAVNAEQDTFQDRLGKSRLTWTGIEKAGAGDTSVAVDAAARAVTAAEQVEQNAEQIAQDAAQQAVDNVVIAVDGAVDRAENAADRAETASDAAFVNADAYPDVATGLAAVADGEQFQVAGQRHLVRYVRVNASTAEEVARLANGRSVDEFVGSSYDLLRSHVTNLFQEADLPVRRYTAAGVFNDYAPGYSQAAVSGGVRVSVPRVGTLAAKHHLPTREYGGPYAKVRGTFTNITDIVEAPGVGLGFIDALGVYRAYTVSASGNLSESTDGFNATYLRTGLGTFAEGASVEMIVDGGVLTAKVNGVTWVEHTLPDGAFTGQILATQFGFLNYTFNLEVEADPVREYVSGELQRVEGDLVEWPELRSAAEDLFRWETVNLFPDANLPVRRYTGADTFNDYAAGYHQTATPNGLLVDVPQSGSEAIKHYLRTGVESSGAPNIIAEFQIGPLHSTTQSIGLGYISADGVYTVYTLSASGNLHLSEGFASTRLHSGLGTFDHGDVVTMEVRSGVLHVSVNGINWISQPLPEGSFDGELLFGQIAFLQYTGKLSLGADPIRSYVQQQLNNVTVAPPGFWEHDGADTYHAYTQLAGNRYVGVRIARQYNMSEIVYVDYWRIHDAEFYTYDGNDMVPTGVMALIEGESECVFKRTAAKDDFTGGVHGDELTERVNFFVDGVEVAPIGAVPLTPCTRFEYLVTSTMHETAEGGVPVSGHPVECRHIKRTRIVDGGYETFNRLVWERPGLVTLWYHGISCVGKQAALRGYSEDSFTPVEFTQSGEQKLESVGSREFRAWGEAYSAYVSSRQLLPSAADETSSLFVSDRSSDSKYYRRSAPANVAEGDVWESIMTVKFGAL